MAFADGNIIIGTSVDVGGMNTGLAKIQRSMKRWSRVAFAGATAGLYKLGKAAIDAASDLQEIQNVVDVAFKDMSYKVEEFADICISSFGMSELSAKQTAGSFMAMGDSIGLTKEVASDMAIELTGLTGDFASFYNISQQYAKVALSAVYTGETETLKRYGIILTEANLQEYAATIGITKKVKAMSAAEKTLLRYNYIMKATTNMQLDFVRTQNSWANTMRVLKENWTALLLAMGGGFIRLIQPIIEGLNKVIAKLIAVIGYVKALLGIVDESHEHIEDFGNEISTAGDDVEETGKKLKHQLAGFDKLNNLTTSGKEAGQSISDLEKLYGLLENSGYVFDYMDTLDKKVAELSEDTKKKIEGVVDAFNEIKIRLSQIVDDIQKGDFFQLGIDIGTTFGDLQTKLEEAFGKVKWQEVGGKVGDFLEGIVWSDALDSWAHFMKTPLEAALDFAIGLMDSIDMSTIVKLADDVTDLATEFFEWISKALGKVKWKELGQKIGTFLAEIMDADMFKEFIKALGAVISSACELYAGLFDKVPVGTAIATLIGAAIAVGKVTGVTDNLTLMFEKALRTWRKSFIKDGEVDWNSAPGKVFQGAIGVISLGLGLALFIKNVQESANAKIEPDSVKSVLSNLASSLLIALGISKTAAAILGVEIGAAGFLITAATAFAIGLILSFALEGTDEEKDAQFKADLEEKLKNTKWFKELTSTIDVLVKLDVNATTEIGDIKAEYKAYGDMAAKWYEMSQNQEKLTDNEKKLMKLYSGTLVELFPDLASNVDEVTGAYDGAREALEGLIGATEDYMMIKAYEDIRLEYYKEIANAELKQFEAEEDLTKKRLQLDRELNHVTDPRGGKGYGSVVTTIYSQLTKGNAFKKLSTLIAANNKGIDVKDKGAVANAIKDEILQKLQETVKSGKRRFTIYGSEIDLHDIKFNWSKELKDESFSDLIDAIDIGEGKLNDLDTQIDKTKNKLGYIEDTIVDLQDSANSSEFGAALANFADAIDKCLDGVPEKWKSDIDTALNDIQDSFNNNQPLTEGKVKNLYDAIAKGLDKLPKDNPLRAKLKKALKNLRKLLGKKEVDPQKLKEAMQNLADLMIKAFKDEMGNNSNWLINGKSMSTALIDMLEAKYRVTDEGKKRLLNISSKYGQYTAEGVISGVNKRLKDIFGVGLAMGNAVGNGYKTSTDINSPSKVFEKFGEFTVEGCVIGIEENLGKLEKASMLMGDAIASNVDDITLEPKLSVVPQFDSIKTSTTMPAIVSGRVAPTSVAPTNVNAVANMTKQDLTSTIRNAVKDLFGDINVKALFEVNGDPNRIFNVVQKGARAYTERTGNYAF